MFIAGYALLFSNLTLMVILGSDVADDGSVRTAVSESPSTARNTLMGSSDALVTEQV